MDIIWGAIWVLGLLWVLYLLKPESRGLTPAAKNKYRVELKQIQSMQPELAIINADRVLEQILREKHGDRALGENLKQYYAKHPKREQLWKYHKIRNKVVHEGDSLETFTAVTAYIELIGLIFLD